MTEISHIHPHAWQFSQRLIQRFSQHVCRTPQPARRRFAAAVVPAAGEARPCQLNASQAMDETTASLSPLGSTPRHFMRTQ